MISSGPSHFILTGFDCILYSQQFSTPANLLCLIILVLYSKSNLFLNTKCFLCDIFRGRASSKYR